MNLILGAYLTLFLYGFADNIRGTLFPEILTAFGVSDTRGAWMFAVASLGGAAGALSCRWWLARWPRGFCLDLSLAGMIAGLLAMAAAPVFGLFVAAAAVTGFFMGLMGVLQNAAVSLAASPERRTRVLGGLHAMYGLASLLAPLMAVAVFKMTSTWRGPFVAVAAASAVVLAWNLRRGRATAGVPDARAPEFLMHHRIRALWLAFAVGSYVLAEIAVSSRLALFLRRENGAGLEESSWAVSLFFLALLSGRLLTAAMPVRGDPRRPLLLCLFLSGGLIALGLGPYGWGLAASGLAMGPVYPFFVAFLGRQFGAGVDGAMGWVIFVQSLLLAAMHWGVGWFTDLAGIRTALWAAPIGLSVSIFLVVLYGTVFRRHSPGL